MKKSSSDIPQKTEDGFDWLESMGLNDDASKLYMLKMLIEMAKPDKKKKLQEIEKKILSRISDDILLGIGEENE